MVNIASALKNSEHLTAIGTITADELLNVPTNALLMYVIDQAPESALYYLAQQFSVLGWKGWNLAQTTTQKRELIKSAIVLHQKRGTVFAIKQAVKSVGFENAEVREGIGVDYDGDNAHDGTITYGGGEWATFRVSVSVDDVTDINPQLAADLRALIEEWKNERSHLIDVSFKITFNDTLQPTEILEYDDGEIIERLLGGQFYSGAVAYDDTEIHNNGADLVNLRIFKNGIEIENNNY